MTRRLGGVEFLGRVSDEEKVQLFRTADVYVSPATGRRELRDRPARGDGGRARRSSAVDIHGYKGVVKRGEQALLVAAAASHASWRRRSSGSSRDDELRAEMSASGLARVQEFGWERIAARVEAYYGFVIRRLAAQGALPAGFSAPIPPSPRVPRRRRRRPRRCAALEARAGSRADASRPRLRAT